MTSATWTSSRSMPVPVEGALDRTLAVPLPTLFSRRFALFPPVREVRDGPASFSEVGQSRTVVLADGGTLRETLTEIDRPSTFAYRLDRVTGMLKPLVAGIDGRWDFEPAGTGTRVTWTWTVHANGRAGALALPALAPAWRGYARQALEELADLLVE